MTPPPTTGAFWLGLITTALPSASAGATDFRVTRKGKLNGLITVITPTGRRWTRFSLPSTGEARMRPSGRTASWFASRMNSWAR